MVVRSAAKWSLTYAVRPRVVDAELQSRLAAAVPSSSRAPKACSKTETARRRAASSVLLDVDDNARRAAAVDPGLLLDGPVPRLLDEWQIEPVLWNHVRRAVDDRGGPGQFMLTGSSVPEDDLARHTGAGRFSFLRMRPMTLFEMGTRVARCRSRLCWPANLREETTPA